MEATRQELDFNKAPFSLVAGGALLQPTLLPKRIIEKIVIDENNCWLWQAGITGKGYAVFRIGVGENRKSIGVHRWVYEQFFGEIQDDLVCDHLCRVRNCLNPQHIEPVTHAINVKRGLLGQLQSHCKRGHLLAGENLQIIGTGEKQYRRCRECFNVAQLQWYHNNKKGNRC